MIKCRKCHATNLNQAKYCDHCGEALNKKICHACHEAIKDKARYCQHCGTERPSKINRQFINDNSNNRVVVSDLQNIILTFIQAQKEQSNSIDKLLDAVANSDKRHNETLVEVVRLLSEKNKQEILLDPKGSDVPKPPDQTDQTDQSSPETLYDENQEAPLIPLSTTSIEKKTKKVLTKRDKTAINAMTTSDKGERREATILFSDLTGFTAMNEALDPEDVQEIMQEIIQRGTEVIKKHGGIVNLIVGDELLVLFGIPEVHEDDAYRAVSTALELHQTIKTFSQVIEKRYNIVLNLHSGIHSGLVVAKQSDSHAGKFDITGDTVNTASRLMSAAKAGEIIISPRIQHAVEGYFKVQELAPIHMKGKAKKMRPYKVLSSTGATTRLEASSHKGLTNFIGRKTDIQQLKKVLTTISKGHGKFISIFGDGGVGKSRLIHEFLSTSDSKKFTLIRGGCYEGKTRAYQPFIEIMSQIFSLDKNDNDKTKIKKIEQSIHKINKSLSDNVAIYLHLLSIEDINNKDNMGQIQQLQKKQENAIIQLLLDYTKIKPVIYTFDDWQFSDPPSDGTLKHMMEVMSNTQAMLIVNYRPEYKANWGHKEHHVSFPLKPFNKSDTKDMLLAYLKTKSASTDLVNLIYDKTSGNAFYIEELCFSLQEQGIITIDGNDAVLSVKTQDIVLPDTMQGILTTRIGKLSTNTREMLNHAAVIGEVFGYNLLKTIMEAGSDIDLTIDDAKSVDLIEEVQLPPSLLHFQKQLNTEHVFQIVYNMPCIDEDCFKFKKPLIVPARTLLSQLV